MRRRYSNKMTDTLLLSSLGVYWLLFMTLLVLKVFFENRRKWSKNSHILNNFFHKSDLPHGNCFGLGLSWNMIVRTVILGFLLRIFVPTLWNDFDCPRMKITNTVDLLYNIDRLELAYFVPQVDFTIVLHLKYFKIVASRHWAHLTSYLLKIIFIVQPNNFPIFLFESSLIGQFLDISCFYITIDTEVSSRLLLIHYLSSWKSFYLRFKLHRDAERPWLVLFLSSL